MPDKPLLTPQQIADKFIKPCNPNCANEVRIKELQRVDLVEYIEMWAKSATDKVEKSYVHIPEMPY